MFLEICPHGTILIKIYVRVVLCYCFSAKNDFLCMFCWIRIKIHLSLKCPIRQIFNSLFKSNDEVCMILTTKKSEVSSANIKKKLYGPFL